MAEVYRGVLAGERGVQKSVAIKRLRSDLRDDPRAVELFVNEASITVRLAHPNVVQGLELGRDAEGYYLVCEWLDCVTLADLREHHGPLPWSMVVHIGRALCDALTHVHGLTDIDGNALEIVHRDITPDNVFVTASGRVKLGDFGVATSRSSPGAVELREVGTPGFAAPEQSAGAWDARSDVFGVAATLAALAGDLPAPVADVLERARSPEPGDRFADAKQLGVAFAAAAAVCDGNGSDGDEALRDIVAQLETAPCASSLQLDGAVKSILGGALSGPPPALIAPAPRRQRAWIGVAVSMVALATVAVGIASWITRDDASQETGPEAADPVDVDAGPVAPSEPVQAAAPPTAPTLPTPAPAPPRPKPSPTVSISLNAVPWAHVEIDGQAVGNTPLREVKVAVGKHAVRMTHPPDGTERAFSIEVTERAGQSFIFDLRRGQIEKRIPPQ